MTWCEASSRSARGFRPSAIRRSRSSPRRSKAGSTTTSRSASLLDAQAVLDGARQLGHPGAARPDRDRRRGARSGHRPGAREARPVRAFGTLGQPLPRQAGDEGSLAPGRHPCAASAAIASLEELHAFAEQHGYPLVLKPRSALGGLGTFRVENQAELEAAATRLKIDRGESAAVEEWVEGHEGFYDTLSIEGEVVHEFVSHYYPNVLRGARRPADLAADRRHQPGRRGQLRASSR